MHKRALARALTGLVAAVLGATRPCFARVRRRPRPAGPGRGRRLDRPLARRVPRDQCRRQRHDPAGYDLAVCRLPPAFDLTAGHQPPVVMLDEAQFGGPAGTVLVGAAPSARGTFTVDYYVCNHTRLTPATLTVQIREVAPVDVTPVAGRPGRLKVTNENDRTIRFRATDRSGCKVDARARVAAHSSVTVRVRRHTVRWTAFIGRGVADYGTVRHIELDGPPAGDSGGACVDSVVGRQALLKHLRG